MHRLVWLLTDQWGDEITTTTTGSFVDRTYTYTIPYDYNDVEAKLVDMKIVAFITETTQEIPSGNGCFPTYTGLDGFDASLKDISTNSTVCGNEVAPTITLENTSGEDLTEITFEYSVNGGPSQTHT